MADRTGSMRVRWAAALGVVAVVALAAIIFARVRDRTETETGARRTNAAPAVATTDEESSDKTTVSDDSETDEDEATTDEEEPPKGVVAGRLVRPTGEALPNVVVALVPNSSDDEQIKATTDADGYFFMSNAPVGVQQAKLIDDELVLLPETSKFAVKEAATSSDVILKAVRGGRISGRVTDKETGEGIPGVEIFARSAELPTPPNIKTGPDGRYVIKGLVNGAYRVVCKKMKGYGENSGYSREQEVGAKVDQERSDVDFVLFQGLPISGLVEDETGRRLKARVFASTPNGLSSDNDYSDLTGNFELWGFREGDDVTLTATFPGYVSGSAGGGGVKAKVPSGGLSGVKIVLAPGATVAGTVVDAQGHPVPNIQVHLTRTTGNRDPLTSSRSDSAGAVLLRALPTGEYAFTFAMPFSIPSDAQKVKVTAGQKLTGVRILYKDQWGGGLSISGRVTNTRGEPVANARVSSTSAADAVPTDANGAYTIRGVSALQYQISARMDSYSTPPPIAARGGATNVNFVMKDLATIEGRVERADTNEPLIAYHITCQSMKDGRWVWSKEQSVNDTEGRFKFSDAQEGQIVISLTMSELAPIKVDVGPVTAGETRGNVLIRVSAGATLEGRVLTSDGTPVSDARLSVGTLPSMSDGKAIAVSGTDGSFRATSLAPGRTSIVARHRNYASASVTADLVAGGTSRADIVLPVGGSIVGTITADPELGPLPAFFIQIVEAQRYAQAPDGHFRIEALAAGTYRVRAQYAVDRFQRTLSKDVNVKDGYESQVDFHIARGGVVEGTVFGPDNGPVGAGINVGARVDMDSGDSQNFGTFTDDAGHYAFTDLAAGHVVLSASVEPQRPHVVTVALADGQRLTQDIHLNGGAKLRVNVSAPGIAASSFGMVYVLPGSVAISELNVVTLNRMIDSMISFRPQNAQILSGVAEFIGVEQGSYTLLAYMREIASVTHGDTFEGARWTTVPLEVSSDKDVSVTLTL